MAKNGQNSNSNQSPIVVLTMYENIGVIAKLY